jgi:hypothetical protein
MRQLLTVLSAVQVIKGFAAKSDGKDKLTALVQVLLNCLTRCVGTPTSMQQAFRQQQLPWVQPKQSGAKNCRALC